MSVERPNRPNGKHERPAEAPPRGGGDDRPAEAGPEIAPGREGAIASAAVLVGLGLVKHVAAWVPPAATVLYTAAVGAQLYWPLRRVGGGGVSSDSLGLHRRGLLRELAVLSVVAALTAGLYGMAYHGLQAQAGRSFAFAWPHQFGRLALDHFVVALAEEVFFRGYLQERLERWRPSKRRVLGAPFGTAVVLTSVVFAFAHFVGEYQPARLLTFFPSLVFGWLRARGDSLVAPIGYHWFCNLLAATLHASHR